jgi:hypothetical protein
MGRGALCFSFVESVAREFAIELVVIKRLIRR